VPEKWEYQSVKVIVIAKSSHHLILTVGLENARDINVTV